MKTYVCNACRYTWMSAGPALECARFGCGSRLISEIPATYGGSIVPPSRPAAPKPSSGAAVAAQVLLWIAAGASILSLLFGIFFWISAGADLMSAFFDMSFSFAGFAGAGWKVASWLFGIISFFTLLPGVILSLVTLHGAWRVVQPARELGLDIPTPGKAVGFLFIPFFNLYWVFIAFAALMETFNALWKDRKMPGPPLGNGAAIALGVCVVIGFVVWWVPILGSLVGIIHIILLANVTTSAARIAGTTLPEKDEFLP